MKKAVNKILEELTRLSEFICDEELEYIATILYEANKDGKRIFLSGAGRSGCVTKSFTNRLMHLGFSCYFVGDITTPPIRQDDILFLISGSGKTTALVNMAKKAKSIHAEILTITLQREGEISQLAKASIVLPGTTRLQDREMFSSIQPIGSSFEQLSWLTCDALIMILKEKMNLTNDDLIANHANLE
ncbi:MAG: 6-phospho-3-hexuloisomerase [Lachnospiraceae bacterium]|nr:6-phospho-3-hexuloisomerase [Lachnospiraceae bacterium]